jgi:DNA-3-methyladenine glycosylase II
LQLRTTLDAAAVAQAPVSRPRLGPAALRRELTLDVELAGVLDPAPSLEMFRRSGDDLLDRWDGTTFLRTAAAGGRRIAFATTFTGTPNRPILRITVEDGEYAAPVAAAARAAFLAPPREFAALCRADPVVARLAARYPGLRPVLQLDLLGALIRCISAQQVNLRWAAETRRRLAERFGDRHTVAGVVVYSLSAERLAGASLAEIRALQFTNRKAEYIIAAAQAIATGAIDRERLSALDDERVIAELVALRGIGVWTAEWILARTMGRPRVVAGDLGVRKAVGIAYRRRAMPAEDQVRRLTVHWGRAAAHAQALLLHALGEKQLEAVVAGIRRRPAPRSLR